MLRNLVDGGFPGPIYPVNPNAAQVCGLAAERELLRICREAGMRLVGPNCIGVVNTVTSLDASFLPRCPEPGRLGLMSQSGAVAVALLKRARKLGLGVSSFVSVGNKADVSGNDLLEYWEDDPATGVVAIYLESFGSPRRFGRIARRISAAGAPAPRRPMARRPTAAHLLACGRRGGPADRSARRA
ncbi:hypothetical protein [Microbispora sp. NPDC046933]|uniref:hypothetical protein n=1 Tax=Microbispora sp. NPDC046933 TaxID=3155618 RepID=UPI0033F8DF91